MSSNSNRREFNQQTRMFSRYTLLVIALCFAFSTAFMHGAGRSVGLKVSKLNMKADIPKSVAAFAPFVAAAPAFASADAITSSMPLSLEVTFGAYLAVLLGTFIPVTFLIVLYTQSEARKAGARGE